MRFVRRVRALQDFLCTDDGVSLLTGYRRAANIVAIEERKDGPHEGAIDRHRFVLSEETQLERALRFGGQDAAKALASEKFEEAMAALATLRQPVDEFFDRVTVNVDDPKLRENRLRLLARIRATMNQIADFSQIEG